MNTAHRKRKRSSLKLGVPDPGATSPSGTGQPGGQPPSQSPVQPPVGVQLREARAARGEELSEVAGVLRIREAHLRAIEESDYAALPGPTYASGFIRAYANHLGLDAAMLLDRFRQEAADSTRTELNFPVPAVEGRIPGGALILVSVAFAVAVYLGWYVFFAGQQAGDEGIDPPPAEILADAGMSADDLPDESTLAPAANVAGPEAVAETAEAAASAGPDTAPAAATEAVPGASPGTPSEVGSVPAADLAADSVAPVSEAPETPEALGAPDAAAVAEAGNPAESAAGAEASPPGPPVAAEAPAAPVRPALPPAAAGSRITIRAVGDSWVQVRDRNANVLLTRVLYEGDVYRVPDQPGLTLMTGNAGALEIRVDGQVVPALGASGSVRRDVPLDPDRLKTGTAAAD